MFSWIVGIINVITTFDWVKKNKTRLKGWYAKAKELAGKFSKT